MNEQLDDLLNTRNFDLYLEQLNLLSKNYLVILCANAKTANYMAAESVDKIRDLGFSKFETHSSYTYIGINDKGSMLKDELTDASSECTFFEKKLNHINLKIICKNNIAIMIDNEEYFADFDGLNFIIYDYTSNTVIDFTEIKIMFSKILLYHRNLTIGNDFLNTHFFFPDRYKEEMCKPFRYSYFSNKTLTTKEIENGIIEPIKNINGIDCGGVCDENFNFVSGHVKLLSGNLKGYDCYSCYKADSEELDYIDEEVVFGGLMINHPGHLILESLAERLWWLVENPNSKFRIAIITLWDSGFARFFREFMEIMDVPKERWFVVNKPTKFKKVILPDPATKMAYADEPYEYTEEYASFFEYLKGKVTPSEYKKIYLTKSKTKYRNIIGEDFFIDFFKEKGFHIIDPEDYTIKQKAEIMLGADEIVTLSGTNALFPIFCNPSAKITVLSKMDNVTNVMAPCAMIYSAIGCGNFNIINVCMSFLHKEFTFGLALIGVTEEFRNYIMRTYGEEVNISYQESLNKNIYDYLKYFPEHYTSPKMFQQIKNQKMQTVLQMMSEVFLGKDFDTSKLDITTNEDNLKKQVKQLTADLNASKNRVTELENTDIYKTAKLLEATNISLEKRIADLQSALHNMRDLQAEIDKLTNQKHDMEKALIQANHTVEMASKDFERSQEQAKELSSQLTAIRSEYNALISDKTELQKHIVDYERSRSWRITKPLRSIAWFFRRLFGKTKQ